MGRKKKPDSSKKKSHQVYATDAEWKTIVDLAQKVGSDVSPFIIQKALL